MHLSLISKKEIQSRLFHPLSVLRVMDEHGGVLSYEAFNLFQKVECMGVKSNKTIIQCPGVFLKYAKIVEKNAEKCLRSIKRQYTLSISIVITSRDVGTLGSKGY